jgi:NAD(P)-dependent dehydrogenase (short-subunit alcohol dehydrogenase family)
MPGYIVHEDRDLEMSDRARAAREAMQVTRLCTARDVAFAALFLASEESATIAGISLVVDGGHSVIRGRTLG